MADDQSGRELQSHDFQPTPTPRFTHGMDKGRLLCARAWQPGVHGCRPPRWHADGGIPSYQAGFGRIGPRSRASFGTIRATACPPGQAERGRGLPNERHCTVLRYWTIRPGFGQVGAGQAANATTSHFGGRPSPKRTERRRHAAGAFGRRGSPKDLRVPKGTCGRLRADAGFRRGLRTKRIVAGEDATRITV